MNMIQHILKKDMRRLRLFLMFWLGIVVFVAILSGFKATTNDDDFARQQVIQIVYGLAYVAQFLMLALILPLLMHSEPLTGSTAFWLTRPIRKIDVMKSKLVFIGIFLIALPLFTDLMLYIVSGVPFGMILLSIPEHLLSYAAMILPLMAAAVVTRNFGYYALVFVIQLAVAVVLSIIAWSVKMMAMFDGEPDPIILQDSRALLTTIATIILCGIIVFNQYKTRKTIRSYIIMGAYIITTFWLGTYSPFRIFAEPGNILSEDKLALISAQIDPNDSLHTSDSFNKRSGETPMKEILGSYLFEGLPANSFALPTRIYATYEKDGFSISSHDYNSTYGQREIPVDIDALETAVKPLKLIRDHNYYGNSFNLLKLNAEDYRKYLDEPGRYSADVEFDIYTYKALAGIPLKVGAKLENVGSTFTVNSVRRETGGCTIMLKEQHFETIATKQRTPDLGREFIYLLVNREREQAFQQKRDFNMNFSINGGTSQTLNAEQKAIRFTSDETSLLNPIDDDWLDGAELLVIQVTWVGKSEVEVIQHDFTFGNSGLSMNINPVDEKAAKVILSQITLPEKPTRQEAKEYILKIYEASRAVKDKKEADPQIAMLTKVGNEYLDLLINTAHYNEYYAARAIESLVSEISDKELIINGLEKHPYLCSVIVKFGWEQDVRDRLLKELQSNDNLDPSWVQAVANLEDPETYPLLIAYFKNGSDPDETYEIIKNLPGIELDEPISNAWKKAKEGKRHDYGAMLPVALDWGIKDALEFYALKPDLCDCYKDKVSDAASQATGQTGTPEENQKWIKKHIDELVFDPLTRQFVIQKM